MQTTQLSALWWQRNRWATALPRKNTHESRNHKKSGLQNKKLKLLHCFCFAWRHSKHVPRAQHHLFSFASQIIASYDALSTLESTNIQNKAPICFLLSWKHCRGSCQVHHDCFLRYSILLTDTWLFTREIQRICFHFVLIKKHLDVFISLLLSSLLLSLSLSLARTRDHMWVSTCGTLQRISEPIDSRGSSVVSSTHRAQFLPFPRSPSILSSTSSRVFFSVTCSWKSEEASAGVIHAIELSCWLGLIGKKKKKLYPAWLVIHCDMVKGIIVSQRS